MPNYLTESDLESAPGVDTADFTKKDNFASLKSDINKLDIDKLENVANDLSSI